MADSILSNAIARRDAALEEARRWDDFIRMYGELVLPQPTAHSVPERCRNVIAESEHGLSGTMQETEDAAIAILTEAGTPMPTRKMLVALAARGIVIGGKQPVSTLSARLSRAPRLVNIRPDGWWIKEMAGDANPAKETSPALYQPHSAPVEPGEEVAHDNTLENFR